MDFSSIIDSFVGQALQKTKKHKQNSIEIDFCLLPESRRLTVWVTETSCYEFTLSTTMPSQVEPDLPRRKFDSYQIALLKAKSDLDDFYKTYKDLPGKRIIKLTIKEGRYISSEIRVFACRSGKKVVNIRPNEIRL